MEMKKAKSLNLNCYNGVFPAHVKGELERFVALCDIGEDFNYAARYKYIGTQDEEIKIVVVYMIVHDVTGMIHPRFIHILIHPDFRRSKNAYKFVLETIKDLKKKHFYAIVANIPESHRHMMVLAKKLNFKEYGSNDYGKLFFADIDEILKKGG